MRERSLAVLVCLALCGCSRSASAPKLEALPIKGKVTLDGQPLPGATVLFMTVNPPAAFPGTTKDDGTFALQGVAGRDAKCEGECKVTISRMVKPDGSPLAPGETPANTGAIEQIPPQYSQFDQTVLTKTVGPQGGDFEFNLTSK